MNWSDARDIAAIVGVSIGVMTLLKGYLEYRRNAVLGRVQHFANLKHEFKENATIAKITELLDTADPKLAEVPSREKWHFLCFFEEVTVLLRAKLISDELVYYMFGYYATRCDRSQWFWNEAFPRDEAYWLLFFDFVSRMHKVESLKEWNRKAFVEKISA